MAFKIEASMLNPSAITASLTTNSIVSVTLAIATFVIIPNSKGENNHHHGQDNHLILAKGYLHIHKRCEHVGGIYKHYLKATMRAVSSPLKRSINHSILVFILCSFHKITQFSFLNLR